MSFGVFVLAVVLSHNSCLDNIRMVCNLEPKSYLSVHGHSIKMTNANNNLSESMGDY